MRRIPVAAVALATAWLGACATADQATQPRVSGRTAQPPVVIRPLFAADYMAMASSTDLFEIQSSQMALTRARNPAHRSYAQTMIAHHQGTSAQLSLAGRRLNLLPSATLLPVHQAMIAELAASSDFDATYHQQQIAVHEAALELHSDFAARGESPTLRAVARAAAPIVRRHLETMRRM